MPGSTSVQTSFEDLGQPLSEVTFVVVDLETTGGPPAGAGITEVGAVKVRGGQVLGEFQTLVRPDAAIPAFVQVLTGITNRMVASAPGVREVLPSFLEFAGFDRGAVLVAHNAPYDVSFLKAACELSERPWPRPRVVDTVVLARQLVDRDEAPDRKLGTLARLFGTATTPDHRALHDARATVDVLHALLSRVGNRGVHSLEDLSAFAATVVNPARRAKKHLAVGLPSAPGVYQFRDGAGRVLYVGTSVDVQRRVRSYFTASETRPRMTEMVRAATTVVPVVCATPLEARVRELRLIAEHAPPYNRRSKQPEKVSWVKLTAEAWPRLSIVRQVRDDTAAGAQYLGPFRSARTAELAVEALHEVHPLRQCTRRIPRTPTATGPGACVLAEIGRCGAPCLGPARGGQDAASYAEVVDAVRQSLRADASAALTHGQDRLRRLAAQERYEEAAAARDRLEAFLTTAERAQRRAPVAAAPELVAARRAEATPGWPGGGWEVVLIRYGRLAGTCLTPRGADPVPHIDALRATGEVVAPPGPGRPGLLVEETDVLLGWLEQPGVRLVSLEGADASPWACPVRGAGWARSRLRAAPVASPA
ncbi:DEDD exonuclease domain-containing protein [Kineococcus aurantiacus]|uniref:DNA polymerase-3 subunit epsilon n=1 Tax=Kineococcus aurantiacus TaxID=37633 RepID=A0A7Y9ASS2_9ACTN|nr:DEDD exonuclease domain-containing protein [Kineococcus aurantiacus]NYD21079.1 DNA polymerase-3 subunit epsilon [Kineococcus aurantiacus]